MKNTGSIDEKSHDLDVSDLNANCRSTRRCSWLVHGGRWVSPTPQGASGATATTAAATTATAAAAVEAVEEILDVDIDLFQKHHRGQ